MKEKRIKSLVGRETEYNELKSVIKNSLLSSQGSSIYISGVPGTGKTCTARQVVNDLKKEGLKFINVEINGMKVDGDPKKAYVVFHRKIIGKASCVASARKRLSEYFRNSVEGSNLPIILIIDELDLLLKRKKSLLYNFFEWTNISNLIIIAIANTMDLPERFFNSKICSRLGSCRINFKPYTYPQLIQILNSYLNADNINYDIVEYCARKIGSISGDARRALSLIRTIGNIINGNLQLPFSEQVYLIEQTFNSNNANSFVNFVKGSFTVIQKLILASIYLLTLSTGSTRISINSLTSHSLQLSKLLGINFNNQEYQFSLQALTSYKIFRSKDTVATEVTYGANFELNVYAEEIKLALADDTMFQKILK
jgi:Cdc6-like AAA superfamily ATPase